MGVTVTHSEPIDQPIEAVELNGLHGTRVLVVRRCESSDNADLRTIECVQHDHRVYSTQIKWATTLDNLQQFGEALVALAKQGKAAL